MKKELALNTFTDGLVMDLNPMSMPNTVMTNCLNGTLLTYNGNENVLLNDMGNGRIETAFLPEGYVPLGTAELGGIIYIVSYNPLTKKSLIGSFPSPERNILSTELLGTALLLLMGNLLELKDGDTYIKSPTYKLLLTTDYLHPGDKFLILSDNINSLIENNEISAVSINEPGSININPKYLKLHIIGLNEEGKLVFLDKNLTWYKKDNLYYYINQYNPLTNTIDLDEYRNLVGSNYSVLAENNKIKLGVLAKLECIDSFSASWDAIVRTEGTNRWVDFYFYLNWTYDNEESLNKINLNKVKIDILDKDSLSLLTAWNTLEYPISSATYTRTINRTIKITRKKPNSEDNIVYEREIQIPRLITSNIGLRNTDIKNIDSNTIFLNPKYQTNEAGEIIYPPQLNILNIEPRKNDGTDNLFIIGPYSILDTVNNPNTSNPVKITLIPGMPFGYMKYLQKEFNVDLSKLGSGLTLLTEWRYYVQDDSVKLNYSFDMYPERGKKVNGITFNFYDLSLISEESIPNKYIDTKWFRASDDINPDSNGLDPNEDNPDIDLSWYSWFTELSDTKELVHEPLKSIPISPKQSYSGSFEETLNFTSGEIEQNKCYVVKIDINYNDKIRSYFRILYTVPIFNLAYVDLNKYDFAELVLDEYVNIVAEISNLKDTWITGDRNVKWENGTDVKYNEVYTEPTNQLGYLELNLEIQSNFDVKLKTINGGEGLFKYNMLQSESSDIVPIEAELNIEAPELKSISTNYYESIYDPKAIGLNTDRLSASYTNQLPFLSTDIKVNLDFNSDRSGKLSVKSILKEFDFEFNDYVDSQNSLFLQRKDNNDIVLEEYTFTKNPDYSLSNGHKSIPDNAESPINFLGKILIGSDNDICVNITKDDNIYHMQFNKKCTIRSPFKASYNKETVVPMLYELGPIIQGTVGDTQGSVLQVSAPNAYGGILKDTIYGSESNSANPKNIENYRLNFADNSDFTRSEWHIRFSANIEKSKYYTAKRTFYKTRELASLNKKGGTTRNTWDTISIKGIKNIVILTWFNYTHSKDLNKDIQPNKFLFQFLLKYGRKYTKSSLTRVVYKLTNLSYYDLMLYNFSILELINNLNNYTIATKQFNFNNDNICSNFRMLSTNSGKLYELNIRSKSLFLISVNDIVLSLLSPSDLYYLEEENIKNGNCPISLLYVNLDLYKYEDENLSYNHITVYGTNGKLYGDTKWLEETPKTGIFPINTIKLKDFEIDVIIKDSYLYVTQVRELTPPDNATYKDDKYYGAVAFSGHNDDKMSSPWNGVLGENSVIITGLLT